MALPDSQFVAQGRLFYFVLLSTMHRGFCFGMQVSALSEELSIMVSCLRESQLQATHFKSAASRRIADSSAAVQQTDRPRRRYEVCFKHAEWRMTEADGQIGIAHLVLSNFLYTKVNLETDSGWHQLELGDFKASVVVVDRVLSKNLKSQICKLTECNTFTVDQHCLIMVAIWLITAHMLSILLLTHLGVLRRPNPILIFHCVYLDFRRLS